MIADPEPKLTDLKYISLYVEYDEEKLTFAYNVKEKKCWYVDSKSGELVTVDYDKFFDKQGKLLN